LLVFFFPFLLFFLLQNNNFVCQFPHTNRTVICGGNLKNM
jgi:hypothetical protein